jgi:DNA-binding transcriptional ArsR family regulator
MPSACSAGLTSRARPSSASRIVARTTGQIGVWRMTTPLYKLKAEFFKTLGHPARIRILELLAQHEHSVSELQAEVGLEGSHMSQQLAVLRRAGVVAARKQGNSVIYSLASPDIADLLAVARKVLTGMLNDQVSMLNDLNASAHTPAHAAS